MPETLVHQGAPLPADEATRLEDLRSLSLLDTNPEEEFDRITRLARILFGARIAVVSLVDEDRQWFKSICGLNATQTPRTDAFCGYTILQNKPFIVLDATKDERFAGNPLVTDAPQIRFYAGAPVRTKSGSKIGSLCVIDGKPRERWSAVETGLLNDLAALVSAEIQAREEHKQLLAALEEVAKLRASAGSEHELDSLTGLPDRRSLHSIIERSKQRVDAADRFLALVYIDLDGCSQVNEQYGDAAGDALLKTMAKQLQTIIRGNDVVLRIGGDQFLILLVGLEVTGGVDRPIQKLLGIGLQPVLLEGQVEVRTTMSIGVSYYPHCGIAAVDLMQEARNSMLAAKAAGGNCCAIGIKGKELTIMRPA